MAQGRAANGASRAAPADAPPPSGPFFRQFARFELVDAERNRQRC
jgi:hypothetical protein